MDFVKIEKKGYDEDLSCNPSDQHYPWGTRLSFEDELVDALGLANLAPGDEVEIRATAFVESKSEHSHADKDREHSEKHVGIQLTAVKVSREPVDKVKLLYGDD